MSNNHQFNNYYASNHYASQQSNVKSFSNSSPQGFNSNQKDDLNQRLIKEVSESQEDTRL